MKEFYIGFEEYKKLQESVELSNESKKIDPQSFQDELAYAAGQFTKENLDDIGSAYDYEDAIKRITSYIPSSKIKKWEKVVDDMKKRYEI